jgi:hypothetical protein
VIFPRQCLTSKWKTTTSLAPAQSVL